MHPLSRNQSGNRTLPRQQVCCVFSEWAIKNSINGMVNRYGFKAQLSWYSPHHNKGNFNTIEVWYYQPEINHQHAEL
jgi:hypothetical protein